MMSCTEPTCRARSMSWMASNSAATSPSFSERTAARTDCSSTRRCAASTSPSEDAAASSASSASWTRRTRGSVAVRLSTSRVNTTAAAGAPPITEA